MKRIHLIALAACLIVIAATIVGSFLAPKSPPEDTVTKDPIKDSLGVCLHLSDFNAETEAALIDLGVGWVRIDWIIGNMDYFMERMSINGIKVLAIIDHNTMNQQNFTLQEWKGKVSAIMTSDDAKLVSAWEIWNEPNVVYLAPDTYYEMLKNAYTIVKNYSSAKVVFAGVSPNVAPWETYLDQVFAHQDVGQYFDYMGIHLYDDISTNMQTLECVEGLMDKPIWVTEIGKPSGALDYTEGIQANYLADNIPPLINRMRVDKVFWYELIDLDIANVDRPWENYFGLIDLEYNRKSVYVEFKGIIEALP